MLVVNSGGLPNNTPKTHTSVVVIPDLWIVSTDLVDGSLDILIR